ncbi:MAG: acyl carrier protein [Bacteroidetes bacterium]|nr:acyl carrier protein [Bacteroidota bacterium]
MSREEIFEELKKVLEPYTMDKMSLNTINGKTEFVRDLKINSANLIDIIIDAEDRYDIEVDPDSAEKIHDVDSCIDVIMDKLKARQ